MTIKEIMGNHDLLMNIYRLFFDHGLNDGEISAKLNGLLNPTQIWAVRRKMKWNRKAPVKAKAEPNSVFLYERKRKEAVSDKPFGWKITEKKMDSIYRNLKY